MNPSILLYRTNPGNQSEEIQNDIIARTIKVIRVIEDSENRQLSAEEEHRIWSDALKSYQYLVRANDR